MKNALILHGKPRRERYDNPDLPKPHEANWLPWLGAELGKRGVSVAIPAFPKPYFPDYDDWKEKFEKYPVDESTGIVGHSAGAEFALRWLSKHDDVSLEKLVLVAPWRDAAGKYGEFSHYDLDPTLAKRIGRITIFNSRDDTPVQETVARIRNTVPGIHLKESIGYGHFMLGNKMETVEFPELLNELERDSDAKYENHFRSR